MTIPDNIAVGVITSFLGLVGALIAFLHKDMKRAIEKMADLLTPLMRTVDKHDIILTEHDRKHQAHEQAIEGLKKNLQQQDIRITKIEDKI